LNVDLLSPLGALAGLAVLLPLFAARVRERRAARVRRALGLAPPPRASGAVVALVVAFSLLAAAATQPVVHVRDEVRARTDVEAYVLIDTSRSMRAAAAPGSPTRFDRSVDAGIALRAALLDVQVGVASMTDRPLPHLFPSADASVFASTLRRAVAIDTPPPLERNVTATDLATLERLARDNFFTGRSARRLVILLTDGESRAFDPEAVVRRFERSGLGLVIVRLWRPDERVFLADGLPDPRYAPDPQRATGLDRLAAATSGGRVFGEGELSAATAAARAYVGEGPAVAAGTAPRVEPLGAWLVLAAALPLVLLLLQGSLVRLRHQPRTHGSGRRRVAPRARTDSPRSGW
jgi:hypothetical protein